MKSAITRKWGFLGVILGAAVVAIASSSTARAQNEGRQAGQGVARSGMGQGEAKISVQSNVRMSIKGERGTGSLRIDAIGSAVGEKTPKVQQCYAKSVSSDPTKVGKLEIGISFADDSIKPNLDFRQRTGFDASMTDCVRQALEEIRLDKGSKPAAVTVILEFSNTRAKGQQVMQERAESLDGEVSANAEGKLETKWSAPGEKVELTITARGSETKEFLISVQRELRNALGVFLDCRRRAGRGGVSPAGETVMTLTVEGGGRNAAKVQSSTLNNQKQAVPCIEKAFGRFSFGKASGQGSVAVKLVFNE